MKYVKLKLLVQINLLLFVVYSVHVIFLFHPLFLVTEYWTFLHGLVFHLKQTKMSIKQFFQISTKKAFSFFFSILLNFSLVSCCASHILSSFLLSISTMHYLPSHWIIHFCFTFFASPIGAMSFSLISSSP